MAISKEYSRRMTVDGVLYRWRIAPKPSYDQGDLGTLSVLVWRDDHPNGLLYLIGGARPDNIHGAPSDIATPRRVATGIRVALASGWNPAEPRAVGIPLPPVDDS